MAIENKNLAYSPLYDVYIDRNTHVLYKRNNRHRKTEINDSELIPVTLVIGYNGYIRFWDYKSRNNVGIYRAYADAFPEMVENHELHDLDPETYCELDHKVHDISFEGSWVSNLRWVSPRINRADTCRRITVPEDEKHLNRLIYQRKRYNEKKNDPEWIANRRAKDAEQKRKYYYERKAKRKAEAELLNAQIAKLAGLDK